MKSFAFVALLLVASASALPETYDVESRRDLAEVFLEVLDRFKAWIQDRYDPITIDHYEVSYSFPINDIFTFRASVSDLVVIGASNIIVNDIGFSLINQKVTYDLTFPHVSASLGAAEAAISFFGRPENPAWASGRLAIYNVRLTGDVTIEVSGDEISVSDLTVNARLGRIQSGVHLNIMGYDVSTYINNFINYNVPILLANNLDMVNDIIQVVVMYIINQVV